MIAGFMFTSLGIVGGEDGGLLLIGQKEMSTPSIYMTFVIMSCFISAKVQTLLCCYNAILTHSLKPLFVSALISLTLIFVTRPHT